MDLTTTYLGLKLAHPFMPGASPLVDSLDTVRQLEDAGASAIVMHSLFEEQLAREQKRTEDDLADASHADAEASSYFPRPDEFRLGPTQYLEQIRRIKAAVSVPVIASLNGVTATGWTEYAKQIQEAGADALELNVYYLGTRDDEPAADVEQRLIDILERVKKTVTLPLAVKLSPFYSSLAHLAKRLEAAGADGLVLFNRFYQPDIDAEELAAAPTLELSTSAELRLRLRWLAILSAERKLSFAVSGGVHTGLDAVKAIMTGAHAVQVVSALLHGGPPVLAALKRAAVEWLERNEYESLSQMRGNMNLAHCPDRGAFERANYMRILQSWK